MLSGRNKVKIAIWGAVEIGRDPIFNTPIVEDTKVKDTWAEHSWRRGRELIDGNGGVISATYAYFKIRYLSYPSISSANWIVCKGSDGVEQIFDVRDVQPDLQDRSFLQVEAIVRNQNVTAE